MGFKTGSHGKVYNDNKKSHGSKSNSPGSNDGSDSSSRDDDNWNGMNFAHGGRTYHVNFDESRQTISIDERYQDENNKWHTKKKGFFAQGEYVDSSGALQDMNERKS
jgi:hypothetical protein